MEMKNFAINLAHKGGDVLKKYWGKLSHIEEKSHTSDLVTEADKESESIILDLIQKTFPSHSILSEEAGLIGNLGAEYLWVIDPLDGTTNYTHQFPMVAVSVGLLYEQKPTVGVVYHPIFEELFVASHGGGAFLNNQSIRISKRKSLIQSLLATGFPHDRGERQYKEFLRLTEKTQGVRRTGSSALDLAYVAAGRLDGFWQKGIQAWDMAAGIVLIEEAGGLITSYKGTDHDLYSHEMVATNGQIHQELIEELK